MKPTSVIAAVLGSFVLLSALPAQALAAPPTTGPVAISINHPSVREGDSGITIMTFKVSLSTRSASTVTVDFQSYDGSAISVANGLDPADYFPAAGTLSFPPGVRSMTINVQIIGDTRHESNETVVMVLSNPTGGAVFANLQGIGTIKNDDR